MSTALPVRQANQDGNKKLAVEGSCNIVGLSRAAGPSDLKAKGVDIGKETADD